MDDIQRELLSGGVLYQSLDGSNPFRQPDRWCSVQSRFILGRGYQRSLTGFATSSSLKLIN